MSTMRVGQRITDMRENREKLCNIIALPAVMLYQMEDVTVAAMATDI